MCYIFKKEKDRFGFFILLILYYKLYFKYYDIELIIIIGNLYVYYLR